MAEGDHRQASTDPFLDPWVSRLAERVQAGTLAPAEMANPCPPQSPLVPPELLPFLRTARWPALLDAVRGHPWLYWHPIVWQQVSYLRRLRRDEELWIRLGWEEQYDRSWGEPLPPKEVAQVERMLEELVEAHVLGLLPGMRIVPSYQPGKPGRPGGFRNPHPTGPWDERVGPAQLTEDFFRLRAAFKAALRAAAGKSGLRPHAKEWYRSLAQRVFEEVAESGDALYWSDYKEYEWVRRESLEPVDLPPLHVGPTAPVSPAAGALWLDTSTPSSSPPSGRRRPYVEKTYDAATGAWRKHGEVLAQTEEEAAELVRRGYEPFTEHSIARWKPLDLDEALDKMLTREMGHAGKEGKPAYLAYAVLGALLGVAPEKIYRALDNYRHRRRGKRRR